MLSGMQKCDQVVGSVVFVESLWQGENASLCYTWNPTSSSAKISSIEIGTYLHWPSVGYYRPSNTSFFLLPLTQHLMLLWQNQNSSSTLMVEQNSFFIPLYVEARVPCLLVPTLRHYINSMYLLASSNIFWRNRVAILQCMTLGKRAINLQHQCGMSRIVLCKIKNSSMHAHFFIVCWQGIE